MPSDLGSVSWTENAAGNTAAVPNGWPEGQSPSSVNDCAREMMAAVKRLYDQFFPTLTTGGTPTAYTLTSATQGETAYYAGQLYSFVVNATCGASPSLNINSLGALTIRKWSTASAAFVALSAGDLVANQVVIARYNPAAPGFFDVVSVSPGVPTDYAPVVSGVPTGATTGFRGLVSQVPVGWVPERGNSIGDASSGATERANADTVNLFTLLWANSNYQLQNSSGTNISRGASAAADYAAHCRLVLPNMSNTYRAGSNTSGGATGGSTSISGGATTGSLGVSVSGTAVSGFNNGNAAGVSGGTSFNATLDAHTHNVNMTSFGNTSGSLGVTGTVTPPFVGEISIIKL